jgi:hypothetical protein
MLTVQCAKVTKYVPHTQTKKNAELLNVNAKGACTCSYFCCGHARKQDSITFISWRVEKPVKFLAVSWAPLLRVFYKGPELRPTVLTWELSCIPEAVAWKCGSWFSACASHMPLLLGKPQTNFAQDCVSDFCLFLSIRRLNKIDCRFSRWEYSMNGEHCKRRSSVLFIQLHRKLHRSFLKHLNAQNLVSIVFNFVHRDFFMLVSPNFVNTVTFFGITRHKHVSAVTDTSWLQRRSILRN